MVVIRLMRGLREALRKAGQLRPREWLDLIRAEAALVAAHLATKRRPVGHLVEAVPQVTPAPWDSDQASVDRWAKAVSRAATYGPLRTRCLVRALALQRLLRHAGVYGSTLKVGVRVVEGDLAAHAWVEYRGRVVMDDHRHVEGFREMVAVRERNAKE